MLSFPAFGCIPAGKFGHRRRVLHTASGQANKNTGNSYHSKENGPVADYKVSSFLCIIWNLRNGLLLNSVHMIYITRWGCILVGLQKGKFFTSFNFRLKTTPRAGPSPARAAMSAVEGLYIAARYLDFAANTGISLIISITESEIVEVYF